MVVELTRLHDVLAELPDLAPSRPLRLIPPVPEPAAPRVGPLAWLRRLAAPAMAAGAGLVLVGAVGASGLVGALSGQAADRGAMQEADASDDALAPAAGGGPSIVPGEATSSAEYTDGTAEPGSKDAGATASEIPGRNGSEGSSQAPRTDASTEQPWLTLIIAGFVLFGASTALRYSVIPRGG
jgi:hypothetical protein